MGEPIVQVGGEFLSLMAGSRLQMKNPDDVIAIVAMRMVQCKYKSNREALSMEAFSKSLLLGFDTYIAAPAPSLFGQ
jgi:hypothetical protein